VNELRPKDKYGIDIDGEFRTKGFKKRFKGWEECIKIAFEIQLDEMKTLLELHYDDVACRPAAARCRKEGSVFGSIRYAHRHQLNQKIALPSSVKEILRKPADETRLDKIRRLLVVVRNEVERVEDVFLQGEEDIQKLAQAVAGCKNSTHADEVGPGFSAIPAGARLQLEQETRSADTEVLRAETAELVRALPTGAAVSVKFRPMQSAREMPLDKFGHKLMSRDKEGAFITLEQLMHDLSIDLAGIRDLLLVTLFDAVFFTYPGLRADLIKSKHPPWIN